MMMMSTVATFSAVCEKLSENRRPPRAFWKLKAGENVEMSTQRSQVQAKDHVVVAKANSRL